MAQQVFDASLVIGGAVILLVALWIIVKFFVSAFLGHAAVVAFLNWRRNKRMKKDMEDRDAYRNR